MEIYHDDSCVIIPVLTDEELSESIQYSYIKTDKENTFPELLTRYMNELKRKGITEQDISQVTGLTKSAVWYYLNGKKMPSADSLAALCIGMRLYPERSRLLIKTAKKDFSDFDPRDRIILRYLRFCSVKANYTVAACNQELKNHNFQTLTKIKYE